MSNDAQNEVAKKVDDFEKSLPEDKRNPSAQAGFEELIERAGQPLPKDEEKQQTDESYNEKQTHSHNTEDTSD